MPLLGHISDWKDFERLCADLLSDEGFEIEAEPSVDRSGFDLVATEKYRSHDPNRVVQVRWLIQCKHYARSGTNLGRNQIEKIIYAYNATRRPDDGLFIIISSNYSADAKLAIDEYASNHPGTRVTLWNGRQIESRLERHPRLLKRYGLSPRESDLSIAFGGLTERAPLRTLLISDQSILAHDVARGMGQAGLEVVFLPFWNYMDPTRLELTLSYLLSTRFELVLCFLGDSFSLPIPEQLAELIASLYDARVPVVFFPFVAWSRAKGLYPLLDGICPVHLVDPSEAIREEQVLSVYRRGDFRWLLNFDSFAEDRYAEYDPEDAEPPFNRGVERTFGLSHSFEFLRPAAGATTVWRDTGGNPLAVIREDASRKSCYLNTSCHACMAPIAISSPLDACQEFALVLRNCLRWLLA